MTEARARAATGAQDHRQWWSTAAVPARAVDLWFAGTAVPAAAAVLGLSVADLLELAGQLGLPDRPQQAGAPLPLALLAVWRARHLDRLLADPAAPAPRRPVPRPRPALRGVPAWEPPAAPSVPEPAAVLLERTAVALQLAAPADAADADGESWLARQVGLALLEHHELAGGPGALDDVLGLEAGTAEMLLRQLWARAGQPVPSQD